MDTIGSVVYPLPPLVTFIAVTDPFTVTDASAGVPSYCQVICPTATSPEVCVGYNVVDDVPAVRDLYLFPLCLTLIPEALGFIS